MITLYHAPKTRSSRFIWLLEEIGAPYEVKTIAIRRGDGSGGDEDYKKIHPHGKVPAIQHDGGVVFESAAIALYLGDAFPKAMLAPHIGDPQRGAYVTWLAYYAGVMEPAFVGKALGFTTTNGTTGWAPTEDILPARPALHHRRRPLREHPRPLSREPAPAEERRHLDLRRADQVAPGVRARGRQRRLRAEARPRLRP
jgi:glutathione S-transferase